jgi:2-haloacid dehalogenase
MMAASRIYQRIFFGGMMEKAVGPSGHICHVIFDLSEVFIFGLSGFQGAYAQELGIHADTSFELFGGNHLQELLRGNITEEQYILALIEKNAWDRSQVNEIKRLIRENFHHRIPGTLEIATALSKKYRLTLLSDHAKEWAEYIGNVHPFIHQIFSHVYYSFDYGKTKQDPSLFEMVVHDLQAKPEQCIFIDDSARNIAVAYSVGLQVIHFKNNIQLRQELQRRGLSDHPQIIAGREEPQDEQDK